MVGDFIVNKTDPILITGAGGFVGVQVTASLLSQGYKNLRCFVRPSTNLKRLESIIKLYDDARIEILKGNLLVRKDCERATTGVALAYHLAAGRGKSFAGCYLDSAVTTRNLLDSLISNTGLKMFVNVSSFAVYSNWNVASGELLDENCPIEREYMKRFDAYAYGKIKQDDMVIQYGLERGIPYTILRPGIVFGPGRSGSISGRSGIETFGFFVKIRGRNKTPLTYLDNCADAIVRAGLVKSAIGQVFNVVDDDIPTGTELIRLLKKNVKPFFSLTLPYHVYYLFCWLWEKYAVLSKGQLPLTINRRSCSAYYKGNEYSNDKLKRLLSWKPEISMPEGLQRYFNYLRSTKENTK